METTLGRLGLGLSSVEDLPIPARSRAHPVPIGARWVASLIDRESGHRGALSEALASGSARNLNEAFQQLNPSEQNHLRERWGRFLDELISLSSERDATIFHHGLLEVGHRLEDADQLELASVVYSALVAGNSPRPPLNLRGGEGSVSASSESSPPLNLRGGQEGLLPVLTRAQARLNAINGVGDWRARLAFNLERLPTNATRWDMLFAMGGAGLVFRGVRLAATARWASSFESAFALNAAATSSAFLAETATFTGFGRLFGTMAGNHYDWSAEGSFNEWAGGAAMLLGLKAMGGMFGNLSERWAAGETAFARVTRAFAPQAGMFSGIVLGNRLAELGGFHPERHGDTWLVDGLTTLLEFNIAGRLQRSAGGLGLTNLEGRMEVYTRALGRGERGQWGEVFSAAMVTPEGIRMPVPERKDPFTETAVLSVRHDGETSSPPVTLLPTALAGERLEKISRPRLIESGELPESADSGPRPVIRRIGVLTSGGDGPAENAALEALVFGAAQTYGWEVMGIRDGFLGLLDPAPRGALSRIEAISEADFAGAKAVARAHRLIYGIEHVPNHYRLKRVGEMGGNILRSSRTDPLLDDPAALRVKETMQRFGIDALVVLGGNGSQRAARDLSAQGVPLVFLPQSIDGDVPGSVTSIGFASAANQGARELAAYLHTAHSCGRWFLLEVMGQKYGLLALGIAMSATQGTYLMDNGKAGPPLRVGEVFTGEPRPLRELERVIARSRDRAQSHGVILVSEKAEFLGDDGALLNIPVSHDGGDRVRWLRSRLAKRVREATRAETLGYGLRGALPTMHDRSMASLLSAAAMVLVRGGHFGRMVGVDFIGDSSRMRLVYPLLQEAAERPTHLDASFLDYVRGGL